MKKYLYFSNDSDVIYFNSLKQLMNRYFMTCTINYIESGQAESEFKREMQKDGYIIVSQHTGQLDFYINKDKIDNIFRDLCNKEEEILNILKEKLKL